MDRSVIREAAALPPHTAESLGLSAAGSMIQEERLCLGRILQRHSLWIFSPSGPGEAKPHRTVLRQSRFSFIFFLVFGLSLIHQGCTQSTRHSGLSAGAQAALDTAIEDIDAGRYEKLYNEAAPEWRAEASLEDSKATFQRLRDKLGKAGVRNQQTAREEQTGAGHAVIVIYQTSFERGDAMETFTLVERGDKWQLAKYFVSSTALR
jgi:hypothetical protein